MSKGEREKGGQRDGGRSCRAFLATGEASGFYSEEAEPWKSVCIGRVGPDPGF